MVIANSATFDGESVITGGYFDAKSGQMESSFQDWPENLEIKFADLNVVREISVG